MKKRTLIITKIMTISKKHSRVIIMLAIILVLVCLLIVHHVLDRDDHDQEFKNRSWPAKIDADMPIGFVMNRFGLSEYDMANELQLRDTRWNKHHSLEQICKKNNLDCDVIVRDLNFMILK